MCSLPVSAMSHYGNYSMLNWMFSFILTFKMNANVLNKASWEGQNIAVLQCFKILDIHTIVPPAKPFTLLSKLNWTIGLFLFLSAVLAVLTVLNHLCLFHKHFSKGLESLALWSPLVLDIQAYECPYCKEGALLSLLSASLQLLGVKYCPHSKANWLAPLAWSAVWGYSFSHLCSLLDKDLASFLKPVILYQSLIDSSHQSRQTHMRRDWWYPSKQTHPNVCHCLHPVWSAPHWCTPY